MTELLQKDHFNQRVLNGKDINGKSYIWLKNSIETNTNFTNLFADIKWEIAKSANNTIDASSEIVCKAKNVLSELQKKILSRNKKSMW